MKPLIVFALAFLITLAPWVRAQEMEGDTPPPPVPVQEPPGGDRPEKPEWKGKGMRGMRPDISPEEREQLVRALRPALKDPSVQEARDALQKASENYEEALKAALIAQNPELAPLLGRMKGFLAAMTLTRGAGRSGAHGEEAREGRASGVRGIDPSVMNDPRVQAARDKVESAGAPPERMKAMQELRQIIDQVKAEQGAAETKPGAIPGE